MSLPYGDPYGDFFECKNTPAEKDIGGEAYLETLDATTRPVKWLLSGELVLALHFEWLMESGATRGCGQMITIAFDSNHKASVKSTKPGNENRAR